MNSNGLWRERFSIFIQELQKYLRYVFNGHLLFVLIIGIGGLAYYYSEWVKTLDESFPAAYIMAFIIALPLTNSPIYTLLKEPDMFFLLPIEKRLKNYFQKARRLSFIVQSYILLMFLAAGMPLLAAVEKVSIQDFISIFAVLLVVKYINLRIKWAVLRFQEKSTHIIDGLIRFFVNYLLLFFMLSKASLIFSAITLIVLIALLFYYDKMTATKLLKWETLITLESKRMLAFYRFANMFTDVPKLKEKVSRRKWLDPILAFVSYRQENSYMFLYVRTFLRSSDYLGLYVRLTIIGIFVLLSLTSLIPQLIGAGLFVYITGFQLILVRKQHENIIWHDLYPIIKVEKNQAIQKLLGTILALQTIVFAFFGLFTNGLLSFGLIIVVGFIIMGLLRSYYMKIVRADQDKWD